MEITEVGKIWKDRYPKNWKLQRYRQDIDREKSDELKLRGLAGYGKSEIKKKTKNRNPGGRQDIDREKSEKGKSQT